MLFNSPEFILFCIVVYGLYLSLPFRRQNYLLLASSYVFYAWWDVRFLFLVALSTTVDFWVGLMIGNGGLSSRQRVVPAMFLVTSCLVFLGIDATALDIHSLAASVVPAPHLAVTIAATLSFIAVVFLLFRFFETMHEPRRRLACLLISLIVQLGLLGIFKYFNFFSQSASIALNALGFHVNLTLLNVILPVGVSFYTFQSLSYTIDIYRKQFQPTTRFSDFALFVAYFPQLQAGPIERARQLLPQLAAPRRLTFDQISQGFYLILFGFLKKSAIADGVSPTVDQIFNTSGQVSWIDVIVGTVLFTVQIYCDFSGYTDIARGISKLFGIEMVLNFNQPYFATNPQEFWRRWHISLSTWLRDYVYISLGGNRGGIRFICRNLMITMILGGLWHGAAWNFVLWGLYQGLALCGYRLWREFRGPMAAPVPHRGSIQGRWATATLAHLAFFVVICYGWLLFRAHSLAQIANFSALLFTDFGNLNYGAGMPRLSALLGIALLLLMEIAQYRTDSQTYYRRLPMPVRGFLIAAILVSIIIGMSNDPAQFIYFQF